MSELPPDAPEASLPHAVAAKLLRALSSDDVFRKIFATDFHEALREVGYVWGQPGNASNDRALKECVGEGTLAPKHVIAEAYDMLLELLTAGTNQQVYSLHLDDKGGPSL